MNFTNDELEIIYNELENRYQDYLGYDDTEGANRLKPILNKLDGRER